MRIQELTVEVRDENLNRVGQFLPVDLVGFSVVNRFNNVGTWEISLPADHKLGIALATPGAGIIVTHSTAGVLLSGPTTTVEAVAKTDDPIGTTRISGVDDSAILAERLAYPTWTTDDVTLQTVSHDAVVAVKASTAMYTFVKHNLATGIAPASRAVPNLVTATDTGLGSTMTKRARFDILGQLLTEIAVIDGLGFDIKQKDNTLQFEVFAPTDRSGYIRMDIQNNTLASSSYGYGLPGLTHAIVAGQGDLEDRQFIQVTTPESTAAQDLWNRRIEQFIDQRNTDVVDELTQAGLEALAESGMTLTSVDVVPSSDTTMRFGIDWNLGDTVTVVVGGQEVSAVVTQVALSVQADGIHMVATVGEPMGVDYDALIAKSQVSAMKRIDALERVEGGGGGSASIVVAETPPLDAADNTVFFSSKDGTTAVKYADADSSQWVEIKNPNNYYGDSQISAMGSRLTAVEGVTTTHTSQIATQATRINTIGAGYFIKQVVTQVDTASRTAGTGWTLGPTFSALSFAANSKIKMSYHVPTRSSGSGWGGGYIEPQVQFNGGAWQSLGSSGHDAGVMILNVAAILTYHGEILVDPGLTSAFTAAFRFYFRSYDGTLGWNNGSNHDINVVSGTASIMSGDNGNQHYMHAIIEEYARA